MLSQVLSHQKSQGFFARFLAKEKLDLSLKALEKNCKTWDVMMAGGAYDDFDPHLEQLRAKGRRLCEELNYRTTEDEPERRKEIIKDLLGGEYPENLYIQPPFFVDYGVNIHFGKNCYLNYGCTILDVNSVELGDNTLLSPGVTIVTPTHPIDPKARETELSAKPIKIGKNCWIGANATICPGVTIGDNVVIAACAVVAKDIPSNVVAAGVPAKPIKQIPPTKQ